MKTILTISLILASFVMSAQKTFVKITQGDDVIYYPPGTQFELKNTHGYIILKYNEMPRVEIIDGDYKMIVSPNWKDEKDIFKLTTGDKVELLLNENFGRIQLKNGTIKIDENAISIDKQVTDSKTRDGQKNLTLTLSNGIKFVYEDGKYYAKLNEEYLDIQGKYVIESKKGILRVSFNPKNGVVWWVFEENSGQ